jgi:hypothetical protein
MKDRTMESVQNCDSYINIPLLQTYRWLVNFEKYVFEHSSLIERQWLKIKARA